MNKNELLPIKKNLSIFIYSLAGGGAERIVSDLIFNLHEEFNVTLVLMNNRIEYDIINSVKINYLENSSPSESGIKKLLKIPFLAFKYYKFCKENEIDVSLSLLSRPNYITTFSKIFGNKSKIIISEHSYPSKMYEAKSMQSRINRLLIKWLYPKSDVIIAISKKIVLDLEKNFSISSSILCQIYNPFNMKRIIEKAKEPVSFDFSKYTFITVGRLDNGKNHALQITALSELLNVNTQLIILGEGENQKSLIKLIDTLNLQDRVFMLGFDSNPYKYLAKADCFLLSSFYEGLPTVILEALSCGLPIISTDCPSGPREILAPNSNINKTLFEGIEIAEYGILVPVNKKEFLYQAMTRLLEDNELCFHYKKKSYERAKDFDSKKIIPQYSQLIIR